MVGNRASGQLLLVALMGLDLDFVKCWLKWDGICALFPGIKIN